MLVYSSGMEAKAGSRKGVIEVKDEVEYYNIADLLGKLTHFSHLAIIS